MHKHTHWDERNCSELKAQGVISQNGWDVEPAVFRIKRTKGHLEDYDMGGEERCKSSRNTESKWWWFLHAMQSSTEKKESHKGLEQHEGEEMMIEILFLGELIL